MKTLLRRFFLDHWQRKLTSIILAVIIWLFVSESLTTSKTFSNVPVKVVNVPDGKTVQGLQNNGLLKRRITITLVGNKTLIDELSSNDIEVVLDATGKPDEWNPIVTPKNLVSLNPEIEISKAVSKVYQQGLTVRLTKLVTEKVPILITKPIGDAPRDYQFLDVWPYQLTLSVTGPEEVIRRIKSKEIRLTFSLNDISKAQLDALQAKVNAKEDDVVSYYVPESWKQVNLPLISDSPLAINDPLAKELRIDFIRYHLFPLDDPVPVTLFYPQEYLSTLNPQTCPLGTSDFVEKTNGVYLTHEPLFAKGVSYLFLQTVKEMMEITIVASPKSLREYLDWSLQFINPRQLENQYVSALLSDSSLEGAEVQSHLREDYLRNRFRNFMNRLQLYRSEEKKLEIEAQIENNTIQVTSN